MVQVENTHTWTGFEVYIIPSFIPLLISSWREIPQFFLSQLHIDSMTVLCTLLTAMNGGNRLTSRSGVQAVLSNQVQQPYLNETEKERNLKEVCMA